MHTRVEAASERGELKSKEVSSFSYRISKISMHTSRSKRSPNFDISLSVKEKIMNNLIASINLCLFKPSQQLENSSRIIFYPITQLSKSSYGPINMSSYGDILLVVILL